jgi:hypothetical protein
LFRLTDIDVSQNETFSLTGAGKLRASARAVAKTRRSLLVSPVPNTSSKVQRRSDALVPDDSRDDE